MKWQGTTYEANCNSMAYRCDARPAQPTREEEIAKIEQYLEEMKPFSFTCAYKCFEARLATLKGAK